MFGSRAFGGTYFAQGDVLAKGKPKTGGAGDIIFYDRRRDQFLEEQDLIAIAAAVLGL